MRLLQGQNMLDARESSFRLAASIPCGMTREVHGRRMVESVPRQPNTVMRFASDEKGRANGEKVRLGAASTR